ncbi:hypothetical protein ACLI1A_04900 [Flavobacterium sp. RHBU_3]|uniref:hypothetical protein n=1 Tax=Flavobacterium sp. RHBU_3 TaxID=3391184 RepID=UPI0039848AFA
MNTLHRQLFYLLCSLLFTCTTCTAQDKSEIDAFFKKLAHASEKINTTVNASFQLSFAPDAGYIFKLTEDGLYQYTLFSFVGRDEGWFLEEGTYTIVNNRIFLEPKKHIGKQKILTEYNFYLFTVKRRIKKSLEESVLMRKDIEEKDYYLYKWYITQ